MSEHQPSSAGIFVTKLVVETRVGRILLWILVALSLLAALASRPIDTQAWLAVAIAIAAVAVFGAISQRRRERRQEEARRFFLVFRIALAVVALGFVGFLIWMRTRGRRKTEALPRPLRPEEVDQLARLELEEERAA